MYRRPSERMDRRRGDEIPWRSEEHTSELQSRRDLVCRLLLEKKKKKRRKVHDKHKTDEQRRNAIRHDDKHAAHYLNSDVVVERQSTTTHPTHVCQYATDLYSH